MNGPEVLVNPFQMLLVGYDSSANNPIELAVLGCRYVATMPQHGPSRVALEVVFDQEEQMPLEPYYCPRARLSRHLIAPPRVRLIKPYMMYPPTEHLGFVHGPGGYYYSQHFYGENEGAAVIIGPSPMAGTQLQPGHEVYRVQATNANEARFKLEQWRRSAGWPV
jgi:hypothetical protein